MKYEVEVKVELTKEERENLFSLFKEKGFEFRKTTPQKDFYIEVKESPFRGQGGKYDYKRYREEGDTFLYTEKMWEKNGDHLVRQEKEHEVSKENFFRELKKFSGVTKLEKSRDWFGGEYAGKAVNITIDSVKFPHSRKERYFIEAEILVENKNEVKETREFLISFLKEILEKDEIIESPGMLTMTVKKK